MPMEKNKYIYKYVSLDINAIKLLVTGHLYLASPSSLNDPFESEFEFEELEEIPNIELLKEILLNKKIDFSKIDQSNFYRYLKEQLKETLDKEYGITCFSETNDNILLWSHYAKSHTGICLQFDSEKLNSGKVKEIGLKLEKIIPITSIPKVKIILDENGLSFKDEECIALCKLADWHYENEIRLHGNLSNFCNDTVVKRTVPFDRESLTGIILGEKISKDDENLLAHLVENHKELKKINWYRARKDFAEVKMKIESFGGFFIPNTITISR